jgi:SAM-dependent methyltransferase
MSNFQKYSAHYDLLYQDKDYLAEAKYVAGRIAGASPNAKTILELGSGTGRHGRILAGMGYQVHGIERSAEMVVKANETSRPPTIDYGPRTVDTRSLTSDLRSSIQGSFTCAVGDVRNIRVERTFDAVISLFHVVSYQTTNEDVLAMFESAAIHLDTDGIFLFDVWHGPAVVVQKPEVRIKRVEDQTRKLIRLAEPLWEPQANKITVKYTVFASSKVTREWVEFEEVHPMRYFFPNEMALLAQATGFVIESSEEWLTGERPSSSTWGVAYILRKGLCGVLDSPGQV